MYFNPILSAKAIAWKDHHAEETDTTSLIGGESEKQDSYGTPGKGYQESALTSTDSQPNGTVPNGSFPNGTVERSTEESVTKMRDRSYTRDANESEYQTNKQTNKPIIQGGVGLFSQKKTKREQEQKRKTV